MASGQTPPGCMYNGVRTDTTRVYVRVCMNLFLAKGFVWTLRKLENVKRAKYFATSRCSSNKCPHRCIVTPKLEVAAGLMLQPVSFSYCPVLSFYQYLFTYLHFILINKFK